MLHSELESKIKAALENPEHINELIEGKPLLHLAISYRMGESVVKQLLDAGADPRIIDSDERSGENALHVACKVGGVDIVQTIFNYAEDRYNVGSFKEFVNKKNVWKLSPLQHAVFFHTQDVMLHSIFLKNPLCDCNSLDASGNPALKSLFPDPFTLYHWKSVEGATEDFNVHQHIAALSNMAREIWPEAYKAYYKADLSGHAHEAAHDWH